MLTSSPGSRYPASVASPSGGNSEYLIGLQNGLFASVSAGSIIFTRTAPPPSAQPTHMATARSDAVQDPISSPSNPSHFPPSTVNDLLNPRPGSEYQSPNAPASHSRPPNNSMEPPPLPF